MQRWPWFIGGAALAGVAVFHWLAVRRMMAVSGRFTALVNRVRFGPEKRIEMTAEELRAALLKATLAEFGPEVAAAPAPPAAPAPARPDATAAARPEVQASPRLTQPQSTGVHLLFLAALLVGGALSAATGGGWCLVGGLRGEVFNGLFGSKGAAAAALLGGGLLVGFGTRMAGGCTSGHGLCGVSRFQVGSLVATAAFFGTGVLTAFVLRWLL